MIVLRIYSEESVAVISVHKSDNEEAVELKIACHPRPINAKVLIGSPDQLPEELYSGPLPTKAMSQLNHPQ